MKKVVFIVVVFVLVIASFTMVARTLVIDEVDCTSQYGPCSEEVGNLLDGLKGIKYINFGNSLDKVLSTSAYIEGYTANYKPLNRMEVDVIERKTSNALKIKGEDIFMLVDPSGKITEFVEETNLPYVVIDDKKGSVGDIVTNSKQNALSIVSSMYYVYGVGSGEVVDGSLMTTLDSGIKAIFPLDGDTDILMSSLGLIISNLQVEDKEFRIDEVGVIKEIDLRYKNPVVR